jgi:hypothetical protein
MKKIISLLIVIIILGVIAIVIKSVTETTEVAEPTPSVTPVGGPTGKINGNPTTFAAAGTITFLKRGALVDAPVFTYNENSGGTVVAGSPQGTTTSLIFDELSFCAGASGSQQCMAFNVPLNVPLDGKQVIVEGINQGQEVLVRKIWMLQEGETPLVPAVGSIFVTWEQALGFIQACAPQMILQTHHLDVVMTMKDGTELRTVEPVIDGIFKILDQHRATCGNIPVATE